MTGWTCSGGTALANCQATCAPNWDNCDGGSACDTDLLTSTANCGSCGNALASHPGADTCAGGTVKCGSASECTNPSGHCLPGGDGGVACFQCAFDGDCIAAGAVCCNGACMAMASAPCGCETAPGGSTGEVCYSAVNGGMCIALTGAVATTAEQKHQGVCGCEVPAAPPYVVDAGQCVGNGAFRALCAAQARVDGGVTGRCEAQASPPRDGDVTGAGNCGAYGKTCDPRAGGLTCTADVQGVGACACADGADQGCTTPMTDDAGRAHYVAEGCLAVDGGTFKCGCIGAPSREACDPNSATPDCCSGIGCRDTRNDPAHCGWCDNACEASYPCGSVDAGLIPGQCGCSTGACNLLYGLGGGDTCVDHKCVCSTAGNRACAYGQFCSTSAALGCCEWLSGQLPNSCLPGGSGSPPCAVDVAKPARRACYTAGGARACCDKGCASDGTCIP